MSTLTESMTGVLDANSYREWLEALLWGVLGLALAYCMFVFRPAPLSNDSYQYLDTAANFGYGNGVATNLVYFDSERSHGRIPAPLTTFPPGYPATVGMLSGYAGGFETTARMLSAICFAGTTALLALVLIAAQVHAFVRAVVQILFVTNAAALSFSTAVMTESMFLCLFTAAVGSLMWGWLRSQRSRGHLPWTIAGLTLAGLSYWVRYAGLFLIVAVILYVGVRFLWRRPSVGPSGLWAALIPVGLAGALMARNILVAGTWRGGNDLQVTNPLRNVSADYARAQLHLLFGEHAVKFGVWEGLLLVGVIGLCALIVRLLIRNEFGSGSVCGLWTLPLTSIAVYSAGICYAGLHSVISFGTRMFLPVLPLYLLLFALLVQWLISRAKFRGGQIGFRIALCALAIGSIGVNARDLETPQPKTRLDYLAALFDEQTAARERLSDWVTGHIAPATVIAAQDGQATGYLLHRRTLGLIESEYSAERWECPEIRSQMNRFDAHYLILYRHKDRNSHLLEESSFANVAASGEPGCGFAVAAENPDVRILEILPLAQGGG